MATRTTVEAFQPGRSTQVLYLTTQAKAEADVKRMNAVAEGDGSKTRYQVGTQIVRHSAESRRLTEQFSEYLKARGREDYEAEMTSFKKGGK